MQNVDKMIRCIKCHRILKNEKSIDRGYGDICYKKILKEENYIKNFKILIEISKKNINI